MQSVIPLQPAHWSWASILRPSASLLGHSSVSITLNVYAHSLMEQKKAAIEKFNDMYQLNADISGTFIKNDYEIVEDSYAGVGKSLHIFDIQLQIKRIFPLFLS